LRADVASAEALDLRDELFDGAFSNFAALNCVDDLAPVGRGLAKLVRPGGTAMLVVFGTFCPAEWIVEAARRRPGAMFRRFRRGSVSARLSGNDFCVRYFTARELKSAMAPWFDHAGARGIGVFVPPSAAEPWISGRPRLLSALEALDGKLSRPLAALGDHILHRFVRRPDE
jgi:SAM-dependent methyltransferase